MLGSDGGNIWRMYRGNGAVAQWLVCRIAERLGGSAVVSIPTVGVCQSTAIFQQYLNFVHRPATVLL